MKPAPLIAFMIAFSVSVVEAQDILIYWRGDESHTVAIAVPFGDLVLEVETEEMFLAELARKEWDLVALELYERPIIRADLVAPVLEAHLARGAALYVTSNRIHDMPEMWPVLGIERADVMLVARDVFRTLPKHSSWGDFGSSLVELQRWPVGGSSLTPADGTIIIGRFETDEAAVLVGAHGRRIINAFDWDSRSGALSARAQMTWLLSCPPDLTGDGTVDFFDFLEFQTLFAAGDPRADFEFDGALDFFDFLAFQDSFVLGCG